MSLSIAINDRSAEDITTILTGSPSDFATVSDYKQFIVLIIAMEVDSSFLASFPLDSTAKLYTSITRREKYGYFALKGSAQFGVTGVAAVVGNGTTVPEDEGIDAAIIAAAKNDNTILLELIAEGLDLNGSDEKGITPLMSAIINDSTTCIATIIGEGVNIDAQDNTGRTALFHAANTGNDTNVSTLLAAGATIEIEDDSQRTPLILALQEKKDTIANTLLTGGAVVDYASSDHGITNLMHATIHDNAYGSRRLLNLSGDVNVSLDIQDSFGRSALIHAALNNRIPAAIFLLNKGANKTLVDNNGSTAAQIALGIGRLGKLSKIIDDY